MLSSGNITIRPMVKTDFGQVSELIKMMHSATWLKVFPFSYSKIDRTLQTVVPMGLSFVAETVHARIVGIFIGIVSPMFFSDIVQSSDLIHFVHPDFRHKGVAKRFIEHYVQKAKGMSIGNIMMGQISDYRVAAMERFVRQQGFTKVGGSFVYTGDDDATE